MRKNTLRLFVLLCGLLSLAAAGTASAQDFLYPKKPLYLKAPASARIPSALPFCGNITPTLPLICYAPNFLRQAYNFPSNLDGAGQTIVIVDAYGSPTIAQDLAVFDAVFHLPPPPSFQIVCPDGCPTFNPRDTFHDQFGWSLETTLDVEWAHAMAPGANIVLVVAPASTGNGINVAESYAIAHYPGSVISQSFGEPEYLIIANNAQVLQGHKNYLAAAQRGITVLASAGDGGGSNGANIANAGFPASDPYVTAIGGTEGLPYPDGLWSGGSYGAEQVWNESVSASGIPAATGGAPSKLFGVPSFQSGLGLSSRTIPDVSYNAAVDGGVLVYYSAVPSFAGFYIFGGTSTGSPQWAAIIALANQYSASLGKGPMGYVNPALYQLANNPTTYANDFHDTTIGNNSLFGTLPGFNAGVRYDFATGWGTPNVSNLIPDLVNTVHP